MRALVLSSVFPNAAQPALGVFVRERTLRVARHCDVEVVAPVPWFPVLNGMARPHVRAIPAVEQQGPLTVWHPRFLSVPRYLKSADGLLYAASLVPFVRGLRRRFPFDLIDAHFAYPDGTAAAFLGQVFGRPVTITLRGSIVRLSTYRSHRPQLRWTLRRAAGLMAVSRSLKEVAVRLGVPPRRITVIPNGVDADRFRPGDRTAARAACGLPADATVLLTVGGIYADKGQHTVVDLLPELVARHPRLVYVLLGDFRRDGYRRRLADLAERRGVAERVVMAGPRPHVELPQWYAAADLFCLPTRSEGWANVLLESMACGTPVVTTGVGGNPEIVTARRYGRLVRWGDRAALREALLTALAEPWDRAGIVAHARAHTWEAAAARVVDQFRAVLAGPEPVSPAAAHAGGSGATPDPAPDPLVPGAPTRADRRGPGRSGGGWRAVRGGAGAEEGPCPRDW